MTIQGKQLKFVLQYLIVRWGEKIGFNCQLQGEVGRMDGQCPLNCSLLRSLYYKLLEKLGARCGKKLYMEQITVLNKYQ